MESVTNYMACIDGWRYNYMYGGPSSASFRFGSSKFVSKVIPSLFTSSRCKIFLVLVKIKSCVLRIGLLIQSQKWLFVSSSDSSPCFIMKI